MNKSVGASVFSSQQPREDIDMGLALLAGAALGLSVASPFGPVSLVCVQQSLTRGFRYGMAAGFGAATSQGIFATAAIAGVDAVSGTLAPWSGTIRAVSALILIGLGIRTILRARAVAAPARVISFRAVYASSLILSLSNPMTIIPYLALATIVAGDDATSTRLSLWSIPGVVMAAATWYSGLSFVTATIRRGMTARRARLLNLVAGSSLIVFGVIVGRRLLVS